MGSEHAYENTSAKKIQVSLFFGVILSKLTAHNKLIICDSNVENIHLFWFIFIRNETDDKSNTRNIVILPGIPVIWPKIKK